MLDFILYEYITGGVVSIKPGGRSISKDSWRASLPQCISFQHLFQQMVRVPRVGSLPYRSLILVFFILASDEEYMYFGFDGDETGVGYL